VLVGLLIIDGSIVLTGTGPGIGLGGWMSGRGCFFIQKGILTAKSKIGAIIKYDLAVIF